MKLVYVANVRIPTGKAHGVQIMKMCEAFADSGTEVELWVPTRYNIIKADPFDHFHTKRNFKIVKIPSLDLVRFGWLGFWVQKITFTFISIIMILFYRADIYYSRDELFVFIASLFKSNIYLEIHTNALNPLVNVVMNSHVRLITISSGLKKFLMSRGVKEERILVAHDGVSMKDFEISIPKAELRDKLGLPQNKFVIAYVGKYITMGSKKGVDELIITFSQLLKKYPTLYLLIVGINKSEVSGLEELARREHMVKENYTLVMFVPHRDIPIYLKASDTLVMNYPSTEHYSLYMSPLKMFEYMASGTPIIASDLPSIREVLDDSMVNFFKLDDPENLARTMEYVLAHKGEADEKASRALSKVNDYTWEKRAQKIIEFIT